MSSLRWRVLFFCYRVLSPVVLLLSLPGWWRKMLRRGGAASPMMERFSFYKNEEDFEMYGAHHVHAVSVGESQIALKLIQEWRAEDAAARFVLAVSTASAYMAMLGKADERMHLVYAPFDFRWIVRRYLSRFSPKQIILIEAEAWPVLLDECVRKNIPVRMANARLSPRSGRRFLKLAAWLKPWWNMLDKICTQEPHDAARFTALGVAVEKIIHTGSVKFDPASDTQPTKREEFARMLSTFGNKKIILAASTHAGEEKLLGSALLDSDWLFVCVPRHAERREEVKRELESIGYAVTLRSQFTAPQEGKKNVFVIDSTGELRDWTAHADAVIIGKSFLAYGGQNPCEAIMAHKPVIAGLHTENFEPLCSTLRENDAMITWEKPSSFSEIKDQIASHSHKMTAKAYALLQSHAGATRKTIAALEII